MKRARRFLLMRADWRRREKLDGAMAVLAFAAIAGFLLSSGGQALILLPFVFLLAVSWFIHWGFVVVRYLRLGADGLRICYRLRRRTVRLRQIAGWRYVPTDSLNAAYTDRLTLTTMRTSIAERFGQVEVLATMVCDFVLVEIRDRPSLVIGVGDPHGFIELLETLVGKPDRPAGDKT